MLGTYTLSAGYYDAYYIKAQKMRRLIQQDFNNAFEDVSLILSPTTPTTAFDLHSKEQDPIAMYMSDIFHYFSQSCRNTCSEFPYWF